jgi:hypothetical protein
LRGAVAVLAGGKEFSLGEGRSNTKRIKRLEKDFKYRCESNTMNCKTIAQMTTTGIVRKVRTTPQQRQPVQAKLSYQSKTSI